MTYIVRVSRHHLRSTAPHLPCNGARDMVVEQWTATGTGGRRGETEVEIKLGVTVRCTVAYFTLVQSVGNTSTLSCLVSMSSSPVVCCCCCCCCCCMLASTQQQNTFAHLRLHLHLHLQHTTNQHFNTTQTPS
jgi:hypothetical protein